MGSKAYFVQDRIKKITGTIPSEWPTSAIGAMRARRKPEHKDTRPGITKGGYRSSPVLPIGVGTPTYARDLGAVRSQPRTPLTGDDLQIQSCESFWGSDHGKF